MRNTFQFPPKRRKNCTEISNSVSVRRSPVLVFEIGVKFFKKSPKPPVPTHPLLNMHACGYPQRPYAKKFWGSPCPSLGRYWGSKNFPIFSLKKPGVKSPNVVTRTFLAGRRATGPENLVIVACTVFEKFCKTHVEK